MSTDPVVRPLRSADRSAWDPLWAGYLAFYRQDLAPDVTEAAFARLCVGGDDLFGLVAVDADDRPVGFSHALLHASTWAPGGVCYLEDLYVDPGVRGGATGRALIEATAREARSRGAQTLYWRTQAYNGRARSLYDHVAHLTSDVLYERDLDG
ncbi:Acetyltransferase (GNAT) family protein [Klenkia soli]|uniref:Acetyltransferase (GNAT) family protein n=1 Tax=Klenkia soli TaxID=1052260 RepID=A0A1H0RZN9_9ACTN|nr:GNAT family N-acetyltransferase [Klenkia soli]SDP34779.1 Acetyltransferase (GNAT) family protein [Klenkia soli]